MQGVTMRTLYLDIETLPLHAEEISRYGETPARFAETDPEPEFTAPANFKDPAKIAENLYNQRAAWLASRFDRYARGALSPMAGRVACIGYAIDDQPVHVLDAFDPSLEALQLLNLSRLLNVEPLDSLDPPNNRPARVVTHYGAGFDLPFLSVRALGCGHSDLSRTLRRIAAGRDVVRHVDTAELWPCSNDARRGKVPGSSKLTEIAAFLGLPVPDQIMGRDVLRAYVDGRADEIAKHCASDVELLRAVHLRLEGE